MKPMEMLRQESGLSNLIGWLITIGCVLLSPISLYLWIVVWVQQRKIIKDICYKYMFDIYEYSQTKDEKVLRDIKHEIFNERFKIKIYPFRTLSEIKILETAYIKTDFNIVRVKMDNDYNKHSITIIK